LRVLDGAVLVLCAVGGVQSQTMTVDRQMKRYRVPAIAWINKLDRTGGNPRRVLHQLRNKLKHNAAFLHLPIGKDGDTEGIIDLVNERAVYFDGQFGDIVRHEEIPQHLRSEAGDSRAELVEYLANADEYIGELFLEERNPTNKEIHDAIRRTTIARTFTPVMMGTALKNKGVQPLLDGIVDYMPNPAEADNFAYKNIDIIDGEPVKLKMDPERSTRLHFVALAFKLEQGKYGQLTYLRVYQGSVGKGATVWNTRTGKKTRLSRLVVMHADKMEDVDTVFAGDICAVFGVDCASGDSFVMEREQQLSMESIHVPEAVISMSIKPTDSKKQQNFTKAVTRFTKEDPTYRVWYDQENKETITSGMGELHLEIYAQRMEREYDCPVEMGKPKVSFKETLLNPVEFDHFHKKQTGGRGEYARVIGMMEPISAHENTKLEFVDITTGANVPKPFIPGCKKGFMDACMKGDLSGNAVMGVKMTLKDGANHAVDSSEWAFYQAIQSAYHECFEDGVWQILEPIMFVEVNSPNEFSSNIYSLMNKRKGIIIGQDGRDDWFTVECEVPLNEMFGFSGELRSLTQGKGEYTMEYSRYSPAALETQQRLIDDHQAALEEAANPGAGGAKKKKKQK